MNCVRRCQKFPLRLTDPMPSGPRMDPLLKEGKSISDGGNALGLTCISSGKNCCATAHEPGKRSGNMGNISAAMPRATRRAFRQQSRDFPAARGADHDKAAVLLQTMEVCGGTQIHLQPWKTSLRSRLLSRTCVYSCSSLFEKA